MKLYEYVLEEGNVSTIEHGHIKYNNVTTIPKEKIGEVLTSNWTGTTCLLTEHNIQKAKQIFAWYLENTKIPSCENTIKIATNALERAKKDMKLLKEESN